MLTVAKERSFDIRDARAAEERTEAWPQSASDLERLIKVLQDRLVRYAYRRLGDAQSP